MKTHVLNGTQPREEKTGKQKSNFELIKRTEVKNTPFTMRTLKKDKHFGVMGKYRITEDFDNEEKCMNELEKITWNRITQVMMLLCEEIYANNLMNQ